MEHRFIGYLANEKGLATSFSLSDIYKLIKAEDEKRREASFELERLLKIAEGVMENNQHE